MMTDRWPSDTARWNSSERDLWIWKFPVTEITKVTDYEQLIVVQVFRQVLGRLSSWLDEAIYNRP